MASNNFFLGQDPLLFQNSLSSNNTQSFNEDAVRRQLNDAMTQYKLLQNQNNIPNNVSQKDYVGELDKLRKNINEPLIKTLNDNIEFSQLSNELNNLIQNEIMLNIKWKINSNPIAVKNIERQIDIINEEKNNLEYEQRQSLNELNDYVKNYSNITFNEYKQIKNGNKTE